MPTCPNCNRTLPASDDPPRFCAYCGHRLQPSTASAPAADATVPYESPSPDAADAPPVQIGGYRIKRLLGSGGMGQVYEAQPEGGGPLVAVKVLSGRLQANPVSVERFRQEGRLAAQIAHPRCVFVLGADADRGRPYIVMELMPGDTLKDLVDRRGPLPAAEAIRLILDAIDGLLEAHRLGVIHRDVKPSNCFLLPDGRVKIGDFGLSKSLGSTTQLTSSGAFLGTVLYASPEQIKGEPVDFASDVYSVAGTLYHLLAGRAPFHHENPTAVLAKIISEDPPPLRTVNPAVPADLASVVHRGLERDRARRYATLGELRAALAALVPEQLTFGGMGVRVGAYLLDEVIVRVVLVLPLVVLSTLFVPWGGIEDAVSLVVFPLYFALLEGLTGRSIGKRLLGLRVCRQGTTRPPGLKRAALRTLVFYVLITLTLWQAGLVVSVLGQGGSAGGVLIHLVPFMVGLLLLVLPMRRSNDFRGLHEMASGTCVLRLPQVPRPVKLVGRHGDRLTALPARPADFPALVGPYAVTRVVPAGTGWVTVAEDPLLGRRVLIRLRPGAGRVESRPTVGRPGRLWPLGTGTVPVNGVAHRWDAFVAPTGAPLADVVDRDHPVRWPEARPILDDLTAELIAAAKDGSLPAQLSLDQVWVQPDGRPQVLDFPLGPVRDATTPVGLVRQTAATLQEGVARPATDSRPIRAPLPRHADRLLGRLSGGANAIASPAEFAAALAETRELPARVTWAGRAVQLGVQTAFIGIGLALMFTVSGLYMALQAVESPEYMAQARRVRSAERLLALNATFTGRASLAADPTFQDEIAKDPAFLSRLENRIERDRAELRDTLPAPNAAELFVLKATEQAAVDAEPEKLVSAARELEKDSRPTAPIRRTWLASCGEILFWPMFWAGGAFVLRGGLAYWLTGILLVRPTGGRARRRQCALRSLLVWGPVALLLCAVVMVRAESTASGPAHAVLWWGALLLLPVYAVVALVNPERGPHDRLVGTWLVPR